MIFLYIIPMIIALLFLFYYIKSEKYTISNGIVLVAFVSSFIPMANIANCYVCVVIWALNNEWFNKPFSLK